MKTDKNSTKVTAWITTAEATEFIKNAIESGKYKKGEIRKSSYRWADPKDHSKGYLCRVLIPAKPEDQQEQSEVAAEEQPVAEVVEAVEAVAEVVEVAAKLAEQQVKVEKKVKAKKAKAKGKKVA